MFAQAIASSAAYRRSPLGTAAMGKMPMLRESDRPMIARCRGRDSQQLRDGRVPLGVVDAAEVARVHVVTIVPDDCGAEHFRARFGIIAVHAFGAGYGGTHRRPA